MSDPKSADQIRAALEGGIARSEAAEGADLEGGERLLAASFRAKPSAEMLRKELRVAGVFSEIRRRGSPLRYEVHIDAGDRAAAGPVTDGFRQRHGDPPPAKANHHDLLILSMVCGYALGLTISVELPLTRSLPIVAALSGAGGLLGFTADYVVSRGNERMRFGILEMLLLVTIIGTLLMIARQLPAWLQVV